MQLAPHPTDQVEHPVEGTIKLREGAKMRYEGVEAAVTESSQGAAEPTGPVTPLKRVVTPSRLRTGRRSTCEPAIRRKLI